ncbi:hypothetical protein BGZ70_005268, partial [Mortierella alpina]
MEPCVYGCGYNRCASGARDDDEGADKTDGELAPEVATAEGALVVHFTSVTREEIFSRPVSATQVPDLDCSQTVSDTLLPPPWQQQQQQHQYQVSAQGAASITAPSSQFSCSPMAASLDG